MTVSDMLSYVITHYHFPFFIIISVIIFHGLFILSYVFAVHEYPHICSIWRRIYCFYVYCFHIYCFHIYCVHGPHIISIICQSSSQRMFIIGVIIWSRISISLLSYQHDDAIQCPYGVWKKVDLFCYFFDIPCEITYCTHCVVSLIDTSH